MVFTGSESEEELLELEEKGSSEVPDSEEEREELAEAVTP